MRFKISFLMFILSVTSQAEITAGIGLYSWQEKVPVILNQNKFDTNATFSSLGPSIGYETSITPNYRAGLSVSYHSGVIDILKLDGAISPRHNFTSYWLASKILYRCSQTVAMGPNFLFSQSQIERLSDSTSYGLFLNLEYDILNEVKLIQSLGSVGDSGSLAYSFNLVRTF